MHGAHEPKLVAAHVEYRHFPSAAHGYQIRRRKSPAQLGKGTPLNRAHHFDPLPQRGRRTRMIGRPLPDCALGNNSHGDNLSSRGTPVKWEIKFTTNVTRQCRRGSTCLSSVCGEPQFNAVRNLRTDFQRLAFGRKMRRKKSVAAAGVKTGDEQAGAFAIHKGAHGLMAIGKN